jgi:hypothetical protein
MPNQRASRSFVVPVALAALLVFAVALGGVWHHHATPSDASCAICLLSHQEIEQPLVVHRAPTLAVIGPPVEPLKTGFVPSTMARRLPARAPPSI